MIGYLLLGFFGAHLFWALIMLGWLWLLTRDVVKPSTGRVLDFDAIRRAQRRASRQ